MQSLKLFLVLVLISHVQESSSNSQSLNNENPDHCIGNRTYHTINSTTKMKIMGSDDESYHFYYKLPEDFEKVVILVEVKGSDTSKGNVTFTVDELGMTNAYWYGLGINYLNDSEPGRGGSVKVSINGQETTVKTLFNDSVGEYFKVVFDVYAPGPFICMTSKPDERCFDDYINSSNMWLLVIIVFVIIIVVVLAIAILVYKIRHPKVLYLPRVNHEMQDP